MAIYNIINRSSIKEGNNILAEHYQKERLITELMLDKLSSGKIKNYFYELTRTIKPSELNEGWRVYDLPDTLSNFLTGGKNSVTDSITSNKKIAQPNNFIISRLRYYLKELAVVPDLDNKIALSTEYLVFEKKADFSAHILLPFTLSKYVQSILKWAQTGNAHPRFASSTFKNIPLPDILIENSFNIEKKINLAINQLEYSNKLYEQAAQQLDDALGVRNIQYRIEKNYATCLSEVILSQRLDANHFKPKYLQLLNHIKKEFDCIHLGASVFVNRRGVQPVYCSEGVINVVTSQHITSTHLDYDKFEKTTDKGFLKNPEAHIKYGDILTYTTGAYVGQTNVYLSSEPALASNHVNVLRLKDNDIDPVYVAFVMNSIVGKLQTEKHIRGSAQAELYPKDIAKFIIPILQANEMSAISECVKESLIAIRKSKNLLEQAKNEVETLIEQAARQS